MCHEEELQTPAIQLNTVVLDNQNVFSKRANLFNLEKKYKRPQQLLKIPDFFIKNIVSTDLSLASFWKSCYHAMYRLLKQTKPT